MKKIGKLSIYPEKVIKNEELVKLKGGYSHCSCNIVWPGGAQTSFAGECGTSSDCNQCAIDMMNLPAYSGCNIACE